MIWSREHIGNGENYSSGWNLQCVKYQHLENKHLEIGKKNLKKEIKALKKMGNSLVLSQNVKQNLWPRKRIEIKGSKQIFVYQYP